MAETDSTKRPFSEKKAKAKNIAELKQLSESESLPKREKRRQLRKEIDKLSEGTWSILEDVLLDIEVGCVLQSMGDNSLKKPSCVDLMQMLAEELKVRYKDDSDLLEVLLSSIPSRQAVARWRKRDKWAEEIERRLKDQNLFSLDKRSLMISMLYRQATEAGNMKAAEMWLKMSGDLLPKTLEKDKSSDVFSKIAESLWKQK